MRVGIIGLGAMGREMAKNLILAGHEVSGWSRSGTAVDGVTLVPTAGQLFREAEVVLTMLPDDPTIQTVILDSDVLDQAGDGLVHVVSSTISIAFARRLVAAHQAAGVAYVSAPVLGRPDVASKGELNVLGGGAPEAIDRARPVFDAVGKKLWEMGPEAPMANAAKIACNMMITMAIEALGEGVVLAEANGLPRERFFELIMSALFAGRTYTVNSTNIANGSYDPGFKAQLGLKDLGLAAAAAADAGADLPMLTAVHGRMGEAVAAGLGDKDWSIMADYTIRRARGEG